MASTLAQQDVAARINNAAQDDVVAVEFALDDQQLDAIRYPALVPELARCVIDGEALAFVSVSALIVLAQDTTVEDTIHANVR